jgi:hypothetical protein
MTIDANTPQSPSAHKLLRELHLRELVERLDKAHLTLDVIDFNADADVAEIMLSEVDFVRGAIFDAANFVHELNEHEIEARIAEGAQ